MLTDEKIIKLLERIVEQNEVVLAHIRERDAKLMAMAVDRDANYERREAKYETNFEARRKVRDEIEASTLRLNQLAIKEREEWLSITKRGMGVGQ